MQTVLIVSPHFPPSTLAGVHRARHLAKYLPAHNWRPIIIRVDERFYTERGDAALAGLVPSYVEQARAKAVPAKLARLAGVGDIGLRGYFGLRQAIARLAARSRPDAVLITGSPFYPMLLSRWIRQGLEIPVVLDFQDPWVSAEGATRPQLSKGGIAHRLAVALEPRAVRHADFITAVSDRQNDEMASRYPWLDRGRMAALPIGGDPEDFDALRAHPPRDPVVRLDPTKINLSYVGTFMPRTGPLARILLRALARMRDAHPDLAGEIRLNFVGTSNQPNGENIFRVKPIAEEIGVADLVTEVPQRVPYLEALSILANSQGLLLIGSDEPHYTASKIYPALMSGRPYLSLFHRESSSHRILREAGGGMAFGYDRGEDLDKLADKLREAIVALATTPELLGRARPDAYAAYTASSVAGAFAKVLDAVARARPPAL